MSLHFIIDLFHLHTLRPPFNMWSVMVEYEYVVLCCVVLQYIGCSCFDRCNDTAVLRHKSL